MFTPESHQMVPLRSFSDFSIGEVFRAPARTITEGLFSAFQAASGDNAPLHYDREFLKRIGHEELYAHGFLTLIQKQVYCGDTLYAEFEIKKLLLSKTTGIMVLSTRTYNQRSILVLTGTQKYLIKLS